MADGIVPGSLYLYAPNKVAPVFFTIAFAASAVGHIWQCHRYKSWKLIGLHPAAAVLFSAGYALREYGAFHYFYYNHLDLIIFVVSQILIYICPPLLELANYHVLGRIFYYVPYFAPLPPGRVLQVFGGLMALVETLNSLGASLAANPTSSHSQQHLGSQLTIAALAIQLGIIVIFIGLAASFQLRCTRAGLHSRAVSTLMRTLYISMGLILIRCIYRLVEHFGNTTVHLKDSESLKELSPALRYEWYFYVFEATLMLVNSVIWNIWNPGRYLPRHWHVYLAEDGRTEVEGEEMADDRPLLAKAGHLLTFGVLFGRKGGTHAFGELGEYPTASRSS